MKFNPEQFEALQAETDEARHKWIKENKANNPAYCEALIKIEELQELCRKNHLPFFVALPHLKAGMSPGWMFYNTLSEPADIYDKNYAETKFRSDYVVCQLFLHSFSRAFPFAGLVMHDKAFNKQIAFNMDIPTPPDE